MANEKRYQSRLPSAFKSNKKIDNLQKLLIENETRKYSAQNSEIYGDYLLVQLGNSLKYVNIKEVSDQQSLNECDVIAAKINFT